MIFYLLAPVGGGVGNEFVDLRSVLSRVEEVESPFVWNKNFKIVLVKNIPVREIPSYFTFICNLEKILRNYHPINNKTMHVLLT